LIVGLHVTEDLLQGAAIEKVFQFRGAPLAIDGLRAAAAMVRDKNFATPA
jgi:hypothetical protein